MDHEDQIDALVKSFCGMFYIGTPNHRLVINKCLDIADRHALEVYRYNISKGIIRTDSVKTRSEYKDPIQMLDLILGLDERGNILERRLFILEYFDSIMEGNDPMVMTKLRLIHDKPSLLRTVILTGSHNYKLPEILADVPRIDLPVLSKQEIAGILKGTNNEQSKGKMAALTSSLQGLTETECENVLALSLTKTRSFDPVFIEKEKVSIVSQRVKGLIRICDPQWTFDDVGGLDVLRSWLLIRGRMMLGKAAKRFSSVPTPKGILLTGPPGCGKSFISEAIAGSWKTRLIRLQPALCFHSLVGQTEQNFVTAFEIIKDALSPCVVVFEEFEKFFPGDTGNSSDGGVSSRVLGIVLDFLQSRREGVFVCATTNAVHRLSPETMRSLRFDACWFIDLPQRHERKAILNILMKKYGISGSLSPNERVIDACEYFSAAEMEQALIEALVFCNEKEMDLNEFIMLKAFNDIIPLAISREKELRNMREWAPGRGRMASSNKDNNHDERSRICPISRR
jgi:ATP-dependent 26S proteasome regulatory subunit